MNYLIIGFPKCGTVSLSRYLEHRFPNSHVKRVELIWRKDGIEEYERGWKGYKPVILLRDPIERAWSAYLYLWTQRTSYEEYCKVENYNESFGEVNPIKQSNYEKWIKPWLKYDPIILDLEEMIKNPNFPNENRTEIVKCIKKPPIPEKYKKLTRELLEKEKYLNTPKRTLI